MTSRRPYVCTKQWLGGHVCVQTILWELNSFHMLKLSFIPSNLQSCWPRDWKRAIDCPWVSEKGDQIEIHRLIIYFCCVNSLNHEVRKEFWKFETGLFMLTSNCRCMDAVESPNPSWLNCRSGCLVNVNWHGKTIVFGKEFLESAY